MNGDFANRTLAGWTVLRDVGSTYYGGFQLGACDTDKPPPLDDVPCAIDITGMSGGAYALVSSAHAVLPGQALSVSIRVIYYGAPITWLPDTMHYLVHPPAPLRIQSRLDVYDAGSAAYPSVASLQAPFFNATDIEAAPYLGSLVSADKLGSLYPSVLTPLTLSLAPYAGKTVYFVYRASNNALDFAYDPVGLANFKISC